MSYPKPHLRGDTYYFFYSINGKRYHKCTGKTRMREAQKFVREFIDDLRLGVTDITLDSMLRQFADVDENPKLKEAKTLKSHYGKTHAVHVAITSKHCIDLLQRSRYLTKPMRLYKKGDIKQIAQMIIDTYGSCEKSVKMFKHIKMLFNYANDQGYLPYSPARGVPDIYYHPSKRVHSISKEQLVEVFTDKDQFPNKMAFYLFNMIAFTGMRRGEAMATTWEQIDLDKRYIRIDKSLKQDGTVGLPKWDKCRVIPICNHLVKNMGEYKAIHSANNLFTMKRKIISMNTYGDWFKKVSDKNNLGITGHGLRHTLHTQLRAMGCPDSLLQTYMSWGSQNQSEIQERYTDYMVEDLRVVSDMIDRLIGEII